MRRFVLRRCLDAVPLLFLISFLVFGLFDLIPGDFLTEMELSSRASPETIQELRHAYGLDQPFYRRYASWLGQTVRGNLGYSFAQRRPAGRLVLERLGNTVLLTLTALGMTLLVALPLGVWAGVSRGGWPDRIILWGSILGLSFPTIVGGVLLLYVAFLVGWAPGVGRGVGDLLLPSLTLAVPSAGFFVRNLRLEMMEALEQPFILTARAKGLPRHRVVLHAFRNALNPLISLTGVAFGGFLSGSVVVEKLFSWPGLGALTIDSILSRDFFVALDCVLLASLLVVAANLAADLALAWSDPRIRQE